MQTFLINPPNNNALRSELESLFGVLYMSQYTAFSCPVFQFEKVYSVLSSFYPAYAKTLITSTRYKDIRNLYNELEKNKKTYNLKESDFNIPVPPGISPRKYQKAGVELLCKRIGQEFRGAVLGDQPGIGKSAQAVFLDNVIEFKSVLIICPNSVKYNWKKEVQTFSTNHDRPLVVESTTANQKILKSKCCVINYDICHKFKNILTNKRFDYCIIDEAHYLSNDKTKRSKAVKDVISHSSFNVFLSGTPVKSYLRDLRNVLNLVDPCYLWDNWFTYSKYFCDLHKDRYGWNDKGSSNKRVMNRILKMCYIIRREKKDVLTELPPKIITYLPVEGNKRFIGANQKIMSKYGTFERIEELTAEMKQDKSYQEARIEAGNSKLKPICELIDNYIENGEPVVVFVYHVELQQKVIDKYKGCCRIVGGMSGKERQKQVDDFQNGKSDIIILSLDAGSTGITLTRAAVNILLETDSDPSKIEQASDRIHRVGQARQCQIIIPYIPNSIDEYIMTKAEKKDIDQKRVLM